MNRKEFGWFWCILGLGLYIGFAVAVMTKPLNIPLMGMLAVLVVGWTYYTAVIIHKNSGGKSVSKKTLVVKAGQPKYGMSLNELSRRAIEAIEQGFTELGRVRVGFRGQIIEITFVKEEE